MNASNGDQLDPHVSGSIVSYTNLSGSAGPEIRYYTGDPVAANLGERSANFRLRLGKSRTTGESRR